MSQKIPTSEEAGKKQKAFRKTALVISSPSLFFEKDRICSLTQALNRMDIACVYADSYADSCPTQINYDFIIVNLVSERASLMYDELEEIRLRDKQIPIAVFCSQYMPDLTMAVHICKKFREFGVKAVLPPFTLTKSIRFSYAIQKICGLVPEKEEKWSCYCFPLTNQDIPIELLYLTKLDFSEKDYKDKIPKLEVNEQEDKDLYPLNISWHQKNELKPTSITIAPVLYNDYCPTIPTIQTSLTEAKSKRNATKALRSINPKEFLDPDFMNEKIENIVDRKIEASKQKASLYEEESNSPPLIGISLPNAARAYVEFKVIRDEKNYESRRYRAQWYKILKTTKYKKLILGYTGTIKKKIPLYPVEELLKFLRGKYGLTDKESTILLQRFKEKTEEAKFQRQ